MPKAKKYRPVDGATLRKMSTPMETKKRRFIPAFAEDVSPTPERTAKPDYETCGKKRVKVNTLKALEQSGDITSEDVTSAERWYSDYILFTSGYADALHESKDSDYIRGDVHTFAISRGKAAERISLCRERFGLCVHLRLEMMLVNGLSFSAMGEKLFPDVASTQARAKTSAQCAMALQMLTAFYREQAQERVKQKKLVPVGNS
ncbi:hypothetical protein [Swingsia samuiensis]|uniref:Uncharacterized protein n=1 Tax=Swingsia samuiensis TaxID=1293412 RepID=A0A4Y6ULZ7_9PROT|nr:hypothetical protein [Swingsia samuiensis]QDH17421.1 hypothetical protein E3D00_07470 [Swingsia samuiensis]